MNSKEYLEEMFPFDKPLTSRQRKDYVEYLALEILNHCFNNEYRDYFVADKPDIQNKDMSVGIEVTEAISKKDAQIEGEFVKFRLKRDEKSKERSKAIIKDNGGRLEELCLSYPVKNSKIEKEIFQNAIKNKMDKLTSYKEKGFKKMGLFLYYGEPPIPFKLDDIKSWFDEVLLQYEDKYDWLFFSYHYGIIYYDIEANDMQVIKIEREKYDKLQYNARIYVDKKIK